MSCGAMSCQSGAMSCGATAALYKRFQGLNLEHEHEQQQKQEPEAELSYDTVWHKNVHTAGAHHANIFCLQPPLTYPRIFAWFTYASDQNVCYLIFSPTHIEKAPACFSNDLALGTVLYGVLMPNHVFICENMYMYKGVDVHRESYGQKMFRYKNMFTQNLGLKFGERFLKFVLPVLAPTFMDACSAKKTLVYPCEHVQLYHWDEQRSLGRMAIPVAAKPLSANVKPLSANVKPLSANVKPTLAKPFAKPKPPAAYTKPSSATRNPLYAYFQVKPQSAADMYDLYCRHDIFYAQALVPTYKCSVVLNRLFRRIKENQKLDALEESDDELEFEQIGVDKFVDLKKNCVMRCEFSKRFRKWCPVAEAEEHVLVNTHAEVRILEQKSLYK